MRQILQKSKKVLMALTLFTHMERDAGFASTFIFRRLNRFYQFTAIYSFAFSGTFIDRFSTDVIVATCRHKGGFFMNEIELLSSVCERITRIIDERKAKNDVQAAS